MKFNDDFEAVKRAVIILERLIEVSEKNNDSEMTAKLIEVKMILESYLKVKNINLKVFQLCIEVFKLFKLLMTFYS
ncbi:hypothetical protein HGO26_05705 [Shewanella sp. S-1]|uniref:Uncharacterized protein n=1 Tax=Shewanella oncorhynchi TaxID=2726434 RepID=A0ABX1KJM3_9GAMM|nr:hypothetical protein [Shewanella oncorhynchi]NLQ22373.1 hypothetical protein [Shewanella oncorhynchi]